jgi:transposase-like protein
VGFKSFPEEFKKNCIEKALNRGNKGMKVLSQELGVSTYSLYQWIRETKGGSMMQQRSPQDWAAQEKVKAVIEFEKLSEVEQGEYLRSQGLLSQHITSWRKAMEEALDPRLTRKESAEDKKRIKELEWELRRKDKALAETSALLILKKKADLIWGTEENE